MFAVKVPYPLPQNLSEWVGVHGLRSLERAIDFPERNLSYIIAGCQESDWDRCVLEVRKAVSLHSEGAEPDRLEIRLSSSD